MTKTITCDKCNGRGYLTFEQSGANYYGVNVLRCEVCKGKGTIEEPITNADHIRSMTDEELAEFLCGVYDEDEDCAKFINGIIIPAYSEQDIEDWLKQPYKEDA